MNLFIMAEGSGWKGVGWDALGLVIGLIAGFFITRAIFKKQLEKNPPINKNMIRAMFMQMGRKPSEAQIEQVIRSMNQHK